ncbi:TOG array regulator of axonemal microtubules protein 1 isoform X2 [Pogoniulus pusillus]|uniref:TOG array regulator of axonemal microtubules protein 1 isoform X2 n=1 Tax=Pogoniulus pusillus TaxID=488313 RepID=UPI0030B98C6A
MAAAFPLLPPAMEEPAGPERGLSRLPTCLGHGRVVGEADITVELPWGPLHGKRRGPGRPRRPPAAVSLRVPMPPPAVRRSLGELSRGLAWPVGQREDKEELGTKPLPPAGPPRRLEDRVVGEDTVSLPPSLPGSSGLKFGLLPPELHARLLDQEDYKNRTQAVEELKKVVGGASQSAVTSIPDSSLLGLISFLYTLLDDSNFKVMLGALEAIHLLALRLGDQVQAFLVPLVSAAAKVLGDNKVAIRQEYNCLFLRLMKAAGPQQVLDLLLQKKYLQHKNSKVREEVINVCIVALLTFPSEELDLGKLAFGLAPALVDNKRRVRHAAMEAFAVLASSMGLGKTSLLFKAVDAVELEDNGDGVMHAVQARLARKTLPKLVDQGFVEYAVPLPSSGCNRASRLPPGADTDWLLMGSRTQSAHSYCGYHPRDDGLQSSSPHGACSDHGVSPRRVLSAGKGKTKLPWEKEHTGDGEGGLGVKIPCTKGAEQFSTANDFLHSPKLRPSPGASVTFCSRKRTSRNSLQNTLDVNSEQSSLPAGAAGSHQPQIPGKCGTLGHTRGKSDSVDSDLQLLGLNNSQQGEDLQEKPSLQLKPTLVRRSPSCRGLNGSRPVPPIPRLASPLPNKLELNVMKWRNQESEDTWPSDTDGKLAADLSELNIDDEEVDQEEMQNSLRSLHNSAAKKRAKLSSNISELESLDSALTRELSAGSPSQASFCSESGVYSQESLTSPVSTIHQRRMSDTFPLLGSKSQAARVPSERRREVAEHNCSTVVLGSPPAIQAHSQSLAHVVNGGDQAVKEKTEPSAVICGRSIQQNSASHFLVENRKEMKDGMSKSAQDKMRRRKREEKEHHQGEHQEVKDLEELNISGDTLTLSRSACLSSENVTLNPSFKRTSSLKRNKCSAWLDCDEMSLGTRGRYKDQAPSVTHSPAVMDPSELQPFLKPEAALTEALLLLAGEDWEKKIEGLNFIRCLSAYHATILTAKLHETSLAVAQEVKNLRSGVSRTAVICLRDLFTHLKKSMDQELDNTVEVLLHKAGESNTFIREEVDKALKAMVNNVTPARALCSLINGGQSHLHSAVRKCTAQHLSDLVERMGAERILSGAKAVADRILPAIARFAQDSSQQTRYYGRKMLFNMMDHPQFEKALEKYVPSKDLPYIKDSVNSLCEKGLGEVPLDTPSARGRRSHTSGVGHSRASSTSRDALNVTDREAAEGHEVSRKAAPRNALENTEYLKDLICLLSARDFRERISGIKQLLSDTENNQGFVLANIVKIFDAFKSRLNDSNSKVNQVALETMHKIIPLLRDNLSPVINMLIPAIVDNNLNSKNPGIYAAATNVIKALCQYLDNYLLLQPFCTKAQLLNGKAKQDMTEKLADLVTELYPRKPYAVEQKVLVVLWQLLGNMTNSGSLPGAGGNIRTATVKLSKALFAQMGPSLLIQAAAQPLHTRKILAEFLEITT